MQAVAAAYSDPAAAPRRAFTGTGLVAGQALLTLAAFMSLVLPQGKGMKMLVPLTASAARALPAAALALDGSARLIATGPLPGSIVVYSDALPFAKLLGMGVVGLEGSFAGCGAERAR